MGAIRIGLEPFVFNTFAAMLTFLLVAFCWLKGERSRWHWGKD